LIKRSRTEVWCFFMMLKLRGMLLFVVVASIFTGTLQRQASWAGSGLPSCFRQAHLRSEADGLERISSRANKNRQLWVQWRGGSPILAMPEQIGN
jgi:hypothetical protein